MEISERIEHLFSHEPHGPAAQYAGKWWTWGDFRTIRDKIDVLLAGAGVDAGSAIGIVVRQRPQSVAACLALLSRARCVVLLTPIQPDQALAEDIRSLKLKAIIAHSDDWARQGVRQAAKHVATACIELSDGDTITALDPDALDTSALPERPDENDRFAADAGVAITVLSSGTTGPPKRIPLSYEMFRGNPPASSREPGKRGVNIAAVPLVSIGGVLGLVQSIWRGRPLALMERFDVWTWARLVHEHKPRRLGAPPAALRMLLNEKIPRHFLESGKLFVAGSAPVDLETTREFEKVYGVPVLRSYGATEFVGNVVGFNDDEIELAQKKEGSVGRARPGVKLRILDQDTREELGPNQVGLLEIDSPRRAFGAPEGWISTNDLARVDDDGFVWIVGRVDGVIIRGGFKVSSEEVSETLMQNDAVEDAAVVGLPDPLLNEVPYALVVSRNASDEGLEEKLQEWVKLRKPPYCVPKRIFVVDAIPRNAMMKVLIPDVKREITSRL